MLFGFPLSTTDSTLHEPSPLGNFLGKRPGAGPIVGVVNAALRGGLLGVAAVVGEEEVNPVAKCATW